MNQVILSKLHFLISVSESFKVEIEYPIAPFNFVFGLYLYFLKYFWTSVLLLP